jgi:hypothetical protein
VEDPKGVEQAIESLWTPALVEEMARDWQGSLDFLRAEWGLGTAGIGYWGLSGMIDHDAEVGVALRQLIQ